MLRKLGIIAVLSLIVAALAAVPAIAANPHQVRNNPIVCEEVQTAKGPAAECSGSIAGLGSADRVRDEVWLESAGRPPPGHEQAAYG